MTLPLEKRFWKKVNKTPRCWLWIGAKSTNGYGAIYEKKGRRNFSHRISFELCNGKIPNGLCVLHDCDIKLCVRPSHLHLGTRAQNNFEAVARGLARHERGEKSSRAILTTHQIIKIRKLHCKEMSFAKLAKAYGVHRATISAIISRRSWVHVQ